MTFYALDSFLLVMFILEFARSKSRKRARWWNLVERNGV